MKKINLLASLIGLSIVATMVVPITSCNKKEDTTQHISYTGPTSFDITFEGIALLQIKLDKEYEDKDIKTVEVVTEQKGLLTAKHVVDGSSLFVLLVKNSETNDYDKEVKFEIKVVATNWTNSISGLTVNWNVEQKDKCRLCAFEDTKVDIVLGTNSLGATNKLEVSTNGKDFEEITEATQLKVLKGQSLYLRGNNPNGVGGKGPAYMGGMHIAINANDGSEDASCYLIGSIMALLDNGQQTATAVPDCGFNYLFYKTGKEKTGSNGIAYVSENFLPSTTVGSHGYTRLFNEAKNLLVAPELPATTLSQNAYEHMFSGCSSLLVTPELKMTSVPNYGYQSMFNECSSIVKVGKIHATTLGSYACDNMFCDCKTLKIKETTDASDPNLFFTCPASIESYEVNQMFGGCGAAPAREPEAGKSYAWYI